MLVLGHSMLPTWSFKMTLVAEIHEGSQAFFYFKNDIGSLTAISTCWPTFWNIFLTAKSNHSVATISAFYVYFGLIYKHISFPPVNNLGRQSSLNTILLLKEITQSFTWLTYVAMSFSYTE